MAMLYQLSYNGATLGLPATMFGTEQVLIDLWTAAGSWLGLAIIHNFEEDLVFTINDRWSSTARFGYS